MGYIDSVLSMDLPNVNHVWLADCIYDSMTGFVNEGREVAVIYLKFSKAFDIVSNNILISRLGWMF